MCAAYVPGCGVRDICIGSNLIWNSNTRSRHQTAEGRPVKRSHAEKPGGAALRAVQDVEGGEPGALKEIPNARSIKGEVWREGGGEEKKNPISTSLITICVQLLNALQAELHALCIVMRSVTEGSSSRETSGESFKVKGMRRVSATAHCGRKRLTPENKKKKKPSLSADSHAHA